MRPFLLLVSCFFILSLCFDFVQASNSSVIDCGMSYSACAGCAGDSRCGWCDNEGVCKQTGQYCESELYVQSQCPAFFTWKLFLGSFLVFLGGAFAAGGGVGGGAIYIPVFILILKLTPQVAVPLSKVVIFGVAIGGYMVLARKRHPKADRPLIDYSIALLMEPLTLAGTIIGVYMNVTFPTFLLIIFLVLLLGFTAFRTYMKGFSLYKEERHKPLPTLPKTQNIQTLEERDEEEASLLQARELQDILEKEKSIPWLKFLALALLEAGMLTLILLRGGGGDGASIVGIECGTWQYWLTIGMAFPYLVGFVLVVSRFLSAEHRRKVELGYSYLKEDLKWNNKTIVLFLFFSTFAGVAAGFLGIGGGLITGPVLIEMGVLPQVAVATSSYMILFTASATTVQFIILGRLPWLYAIWYFVVGIGAAIVGQFGVAEILRRYKKQAFINFLLATIIVISVISVVAIEGTNLANNIKANLPWMTFGAICQVN